MDNKILNLIFALLLIFLINSKKTEAGIFVTTPEFHGQILDSATGKPLKNVKIIVTWEGTEKTAGSAKQVFNGIEVISDSNGKYKIDKKTALHITSDLEDVFLTIEHPSYIAIKKRSIWTWNNNTNSESVQGTMQKDGTVKYNIKLEKVK